jgi:hypothetical protein
MRRQVEAQRQEMGRLAAELNRAAADTQTSGSATPAQRDLRMREIRQRVASLVSTTETVAEQAGAASAIFTQLGSEDGAKAAAFVSAAGALTAAIGRAYLGDPSALLPAFATVGGMFGRRPDPNAAVLAALRRLSEQIARNHAAVMDRFDRVDYSLALTAELARASVTRDLAICSSMNDAGAAIGGWQFSRTSPAFVDHGDTSAFASYNDVTRFVERVSVANVRSCVQSLVALFSPDQSLAVFQAGLTSNRYSLDESSRTSLGAVEDRRIRWLGDIHRLTASFFDRTNFLLLAAEPSLTADQLNLTAAARDLLQRQRDESATVERLRYMETNFHRLISVPAFVSAAQYVPLFNPFYELLDGSRTRLWTTDELARGAGSQDTNGRGVAERAERIAALGVMQESFWSGGPLLPIFYRAYINDRSAWTNPDDVLLKWLLRSDVQRTPAAWANFRRALLPLFRDNRLIISNMIWYDLYQNFQGDIGRYERAQQSGHLSYLRSFWRSRIPDLRFVTTPDWREGQNRWSVRIGDVTYPLPDLASFEQRRMLQTSTFQPVLVLREALRREVINQILGKDNRVSAEDRRLVASFGVVPQ